MPASVTPLPPRKLHGGKGRDRSRSDGSDGTSAAVREREFLQDEARQVGVFGELADALADIGLVDHDFGAARLIRGGEADLLEQALEDRVQPARADILDR